MPFSKNFKSNLVGRPTYYLLRGYVKGVIMEHLNTKLKSSLNIHSLACGNDKKQAPVFRIVLKYLLVYSPKSISKKIAEIYRKPWVETKNSRKAFSKVIEADPEEITPNRNQYQNITMPTLILWSENDPLFSLRIARQLKDDIPNAGLISLPKCSHFLQEDNPRLIIQHLIEFFRFDRQQR